MNKCYYLLLVLIGWSCSEQKEANTTLFESLPTSRTHIDFTNNVEDSKEFNIFNYRNFYNGGGVAIGDVNNDGWSDVFLVSNMGDNQLYMNKGSSKNAAFQFENVTKQAGVGGKRAWSTGVTFADVNGDGWVDIYVCNSGNRPGDDRANELYINNGLSASGIPTFTEKAAEYGLADKAYSTHAAFFDYDRDGDLDMYLLNNSFISPARLQYANIRQERDSLGGGKLFRNDGGHFADVSEKAGIYGSLIGFGLGITIGDVNNDNWLDIFISNDFYEHDYLYINNQNGSFTEASKEWMPHQSLSSMGADIADLNNDGNLDIFVTDMLPGDDARLKTTSTFESYDLFQLKLSRDFHYQYMQNMLHLNTPLTKDGRRGVFTEVARLAGVHATDWSWGALLFDMDNDGLKDIFVANGIAKDLTDQDFVNYLANEDNIRQRKAQMDAGLPLDLKGLLDKMPSKKIPNYAFQNQGNLLFANQAAAWGLGEPGFSNGAAYGDLDNDGDLDLVVNNVNSPVSVYKNKSNELLHPHYLKIRLQGYAKNLHGVGAKVYVHQRDKQLVQQQIPNRGFQSSVDPNLVFGLGKNALIDSVTVIWPDDKQQVLKAVKADQLLTLDHKQANQFMHKSVEEESQPFKDVTQEVQLDYTHEESNFVDFNRDPLLKQMYSTQGPALATGDVNGDGLEDVYLGGAKGKAKNLFLQTKTGTFRRASVAAFAKDEPTEDVAALLFDADNDKDLDLFVVTGSNEFGKDDPDLQDRLYLNDGKGHFTKDSRFPNVYQSGSCVAASDFDRDGDLDLFVGGRLLPSEYGLSPVSLLYVNDGTGNFKNYTKRYLPTSELGMVTDATWADVNHDTYPDLILVGDWMPILILQNNRGKSFVQAPNSPIAHSEGWWNCIRAADIDGDGDMDFVLGNQGRNNRIPASEKQPAELYVKDFDGNGTLEQILNCYTEDGKSYPMALKHDLQKQLPLVKKRFVKYADYAGKQMSAIFKPEELQNALVRKVTNPNTSLLINAGNGKFTLENLPLEAQVSPVCGIETMDYNSDGKLDVLLFGNFFDVLPEMGRYDANYGVLLAGKGNGKFDVVKQANSGFFVGGQVRRVKKIKSAGNQELIILAKNNAHVQVYTHQQK